MEIQKCIRMLKRWHGGEGTGVYTVASRLVAGQPVPDDEARRAVAELTEQRDHHLDHLGRGGNDAAVRADVEELEALIAWLSPPADGSRDLAEPVRAATEPGRGAREREGRQVAATDDRVPTGSLGSVPYGHPLEESSDRCPDATGGPREVRPRHPEIALTREEWQTLAVEDVVGGIAAKLYLSHGAAETRRFLAEVSKDAGAWRDTVRRRVTVRGEPE